VNDNDAHAVSTQLLLVIHYNAGDFLYYSAASSSRQTSYCELRHDSQSSSHRTCGLQIVPVSIQWIRSYGESRGNV